MPSDLRAGFAQASWIGGIESTLAAIALLANRFDVMWAMSQVGHADAKMTTDVYAQLQQRSRRDHGQARPARARSSECRHCSEAAQHHAKQVLNADRPISRLTRARRVLRGRG